MVSDVRHGQAAKEKNDTYPLCLNVYATIFKVLKNKATKGPRVHQMLWLKSSWPAFYCGETKEQGEGEEQ